MTTPHPLSPAAQNPVAGTAERAYDRFRADAYTVLGALLAGPPDTGLLAWLASIAVDPTSTAPMSQAWRGLVDAATGSESSLVEDEYQALFIGLGKGEVVPYGSWYLTGFLMEQPLVALRSDLRALGIEADEHHHEPEDHVAALCQVMALLASPDEEYPEACQHSFFDRHLKRWYRRFFDDLRNAPSARFYRAVGDFGTIFLDQEALHLEE